MRQHIDSAVKSAGEHWPVLRAAAERGAARAFAGAWAGFKRGAALAWAATVKVAGWSRRAALGTLEVIERTLLDHNGRERIQATATFALIFAFGVTATDFLLTGGPELSPGARAAPYVSQANLISARTGGDAVIELAMAAPMDLTAVQEEVAAVEEVAAAEPDFTALIDAPGKDQAELITTEGQQARTKAKPESATL